MQFSQLSGALAPSFSPSDKLSGKLASSGQRAGLDQGLSDQQRSSRVTDSSASAPEKRQTALQIVERTLTLGYQKLSASYQRASSPAAFEPLSAEQVASNILGFIEHRLRQDAAQGATEEQLQSRLEAGLSGFNKGFAEAKEKLDALSLLTPEIQQDIGQTQELVLSGIEALRERVLSGALEAKPDMARKPEPEASEQNSRASTSGHYEYARASEFSFSLQTAEGDRVTIKARDSLVLAGRYENRESGYNLAAGGSSAQRFGISVEGNLNEQEQSSIVELLSKVDKLATQFFAGDLDQAFAQAQKLGYDSEQIAAFSLNLSQVEVRRASQTYQQIANPGQRAGQGRGETATGLRAGLETLTEFLQTLNSALEAARKLTQQPEMLVAGLSAKLVRAESAADFEPGRRLRDFVDQLTTVKR